MIPPSGQLLLSFLRTFLDGPERPVSLGAGQDGDWPALALMAEQTTLSFQVLHVAAVAALPSGCVKRLQTRIRDTAVRNALHHGRLKQLIDQCARHGIPVLLVKGLWLVHCVYRDAAARDSGDIDLLFRPDDIPRFTQVARELGYQVPADGVSLSAQAQSTNEFALRHPDTGLLVDVHWALTHPATETPVDEDLLWKRSELVDLAGLPCCTLNLEDHLLYLCFHAAIHHKFWAVGPRCLFDIAMVIRHPPRPIRWDELGERAQALGWGRAAWLMFALVHEHLGVSAPPAVMEALHRELPQDAKVRELALEAIFAAREQKSLYRHLARMLAPGASGRRSGLGHLMFPSRVQMTNQFGVSSGIPTWQLHLKRWALKLREWGPEIGRLLLGRRAQREELARTRQIECWLAGGT